MLQAELSEALRRDQADHASVKAELEAVRSRIAKLVAQIEREDDALRSLTARLRELEFQEDGLVRQLGAAASEPVVRLPANYATVYARAVADLALISPQAKAGWRGRRCAR